MCMMELTPEEPGSQLSEHSSKVVRFCEWITHGLACILLTFMSVVTMYGSNTLTDNLLTNEKLYYYVLYVSITLSCIAETLFMAGVYLKKAFCKGLGVGFYALGVVGFFFSITQPWSWIPAITGTLFASGAMASLFSCC